MDRPVHGFSQAVSEEKTVTQSSTPPRSSLEKEVLRVVENVPIADTHEHILEESSRLQPEDRWRLDDIGVLFSHYAESDLLVAGMSREDLERVHTQGVPAEEKWKLVKPWYEACRQTGYLRNVRETVQALYGVDDITDETFERVNQGVKDLIQPGYYRHVLLDVAKVDHCQVNSLERSPYCETSYPDLLLQDISTVAFVSAADKEHHAQVAGNGKVTSLDDWHAVINTCFAKYAPRAIATKNQMAYERRLDYEQVSASDAGPIFDRYLMDKESVSPEERKAFEDHLFHYCVRKAAEHHLPVKLHTGYYAGENRMPLHRVGANPGDMCELLFAHPDVPFVFMHITYPYQDEAIVIAKQFPNAYIDMCWAWIINPVAAQRFLREFLAAAPVNKVLTFGGDYCPVELMVGHARIARRGIARVLTGMLEDGELAESELPDLAERLLRRNARELFDVESVARNAAAAAKTEVVE
jgi:predicted TIM-barrel fold metal-dependent hydrolase